MEWLKGLFGKGNAQKPTSSAIPKKIPIPDDELSAFKQWYVEQRKPALALVPDPSLPIDTFSSRLFGPAFIPDGEEWPVGADGRTLNFLAQLNLADCHTLANYPRSGIVQFFIGRDDLLGANFDDLLAGNYLIRYFRPDAPGALQEPPHSGERDPSGIDDYSPANNFEFRKRGVILVAEPFEDIIDLSVKEAAQRFDAIPREYDLDALYEIVEADEQQRLMHHNTGGFPAFTQTDIRFDERYAPYDHVLLRLTSDDFSMWGDVGECVFMMRSTDLAEGNFSEVVYSWDCS